VLLDQEQCRGYRKCVEACPYKKTMYRGNTRTSEKSIACYPRVEGRDPESGGLPMQTRCMAACIGQIRMQGLVKLDKDGGSRSPHPRTRQSSSSSKAAPARLPDLRAGHNW
jgi:nitrate reductase beta subunit